MDGRELAARAVALVPGLRVVLMIAPGEAVQQLGFGGLPCVTKPVFRDRLAALLVELLGPPVREPSRRPSMGRPRSRRRPSGSHPA
jgi:hypothetical protein